MATGSCSSLCHLAYGSTGERLGRIASDLEVSFLHEAVDENLMLRQAARVMAIANYDLHTSPPIFNMQDRWCAMSKKVGVFQL